MRRAFALATAVLVTSGCGRADNESATMRALQRPDLQRQLRTLTGGGYSGAVGLLRTPAGTWRGAAGYANERTKRRATPQDRFDIASTTKTFVATLVLQLMADGRLSLDDTVEKRLPGLLPYGRRITIRELLNHTSGLPGDLSIGGAPRARVTQAAAQPLTSEPGTSFAYSNLNYVVAGLIVEQVTGRSLDVVLRDRIVRPLGLRETGYRPPAHVSWLGAPEPMNSPSGDGGIVSTVDDLATFFGALLGGELLGPDLLSQMMRTVDTGTPDRAGLGLFRLRAACGFVWGHGGAGLEYSTMAVGSRDGSRIAVVADNQFDFAAAQDVAERMYCS